VHKAVLLDGRVVAVKVQRPNVVPMLLGDIGNLKAFSLKLRAQLPIDYYTVRVVFASSSSLRLHTKYKKTFREPKVSSSSSFTSRPAVENVVSNMRHTSCESAWVFVLFVVSPQVFCELGRALEYELDFLHEAQAAEKIWAAVSHTIGGEPAAPSLVVPRPIPNLASRRRVRPALPRKLPRHGRSSPQIHFFA
jgi:hypothetical protein